MQLDRTERRILGSLIEKRWSTPDQYPLSFNALAAACRQRSNRDPVLALEDFEIEGCLLALREKGLVLVAEREGGHVPRYGERVAAALDLDRTAAAILAELLLRGPQTAPELSRRIGRMAPGTDLGGVEEALSELARTGLVRLQARRPGQRHARWTHLLAPEEEAPLHPEPESPPSPPSSLALEVADLRGRVARLERLLAERGLLDLID